jgi:hypothetical protein
MCNVHAIPVQLHGHFLTAVKTLGIGSFADTGHKTTLYGSSTDTQNLPFSRRNKNDQYNCRGKLFYETLRVLIFMAVLWTPKIYHFLAEPKTIRTTTNVCSSVKLLYMEVLWTAKVCSSNRSWKVRLKLHRSTLMRLKYWENFNAGPLRSQADISPRMFWVFNYELKD